MDGGVSRLGEKRFVPSFATVLQCSRTLRAALENAARFLSSAPCRVRIPAHGRQKARYREGNGLLKLNGAPSGMSACGCAARFRCGASRLACCAGKRCAFPQLRTLPGSNPGVWVAKKPATGRVTGFSIQMVPPAGFEPAISTLKGWRPWPLDDGDSAVEYTRYLVCEKPIFHVNSYC